MAERTGNGGHGLVKGATVFGLAVPMIVIVPLVMLMSLSTILVAMVQAQYGTTCGVANASGSTSWVSWSNRSTARTVDCPTRPEQRPHGSNGPRTSPRTIPTATVSRVVPATRTTIAPAWSTTR